MKHLHTWLTLPALAALLITPLPSAWSAPGTVAAMGGGWIQPCPVRESDTSTGVQESAVPVQNTKATFGFVASRTLPDNGTVGETQGELTYHDHGVGLRVHSLSVESVEVLADLSVRFTGTAEVTTSAGTEVRSYVVTVRDAGEPGRADTLRIRLLGFQLPGEATDYHREGELGGGNIQTR